MPIRMPVSSKYSRIDSSMTSVTGIVAAGLTLPVEVLINTSPSEILPADAAARIAKSEASRTFSRVSSSPVSRMIFRWALPQAKVDDASCVVGP